MVKIVIDCQVKPGSIWDTLAKALGREPTRSENTAAVRYILSGGKLADFISDIQSKM